MEGLVPMVGPGVGECLKDSSAPVRMAAERCALHLLQLTQGVVSNCHCALLQTTLTQLAIFNTEVSN